MSLREIGEKRLTDTTCKMVFGSGEMYENNAFWRFSRR